jgi:hypothetical protein
MYLKLDSQILQVDLLSQLSKTWKNGRPMEGMMIS